MTATDAVYSGATVLPPVSTVLTTLSIVPAVEEPLVASPLRPSAPEGVVLEPQGGAADPPPEDEAVTCTEEGRQTHVV